MVIAVTALFGCDEGHGGSIDGLVSVGGEDPSGIEIFAGNGQTILSTMTDATGRFHFDSAPAGSVMVTCQAEGRSLEGNLVETWDGDDLLFALTPAGQITFHVGDHAVTSVKLDGADPPWVDYGGGHLFITITATPGAHTLSISSDLPDFDVSTTFVYAQTLDLGDLLGYAARANATGRVIVTGAIGALPALVVHYSGASDGTLSTDSTGAYSLSGAIVGDYTFCFDTPTAAMVPPSHEAQPSCRKATLQPNLTTQLPDMTFLGLGTVSGKVTLGGAQPGSADVGVGTSYVVANMFFTQVAADGTYSLTWFAGDQPLTVFKNHNATSQQISIPTLPWGGAVIAPDTDVPP